MLISSLTLAANLFPFIPTSSGPRLPISKGFPDGVCMAGDKYRIKSATIALFWEEGRHVAHMVPTGSIITIDSEQINGNKLTEVLWAEKKVMMFTQDIRSRGEKLKTVTAGSPIARHFD